MEDFPLNELLSATDLDKIHVYNGNEGRECRLARCSQMKEFTNVAQEVAKKRNGSIPIKIVPTHAKLQERTRT